MDRMLATNRLSERPSPVPGSGIQKPSIFDRVDVFDPLDIDTSFLMTEGNELLEGGLPALSLPSTNFQSTGTEEDLAWTRTFGRSFLICLRWLKALMPDHQHGGMRRLMVAMMVTWTNFSPRIPCEQASDGSS